MPTQVKQPKSAADVLDYLDSQPMLLTYRTASPALNFSEDAIRQWINDGTIPTVQFGTRNYIQQSWLRQFLGLPPVGSDQ